MLLLVFGAIGAAQNSFFCFAKLFVDPGFQVVRHRTIGVGVVVALQGIEAVCIVVNELSPFTRGCGL